MIKYSKKTKSPLLASSQFLVYSEFVLTKGTRFYYVSSADVINTFYKLRTDFDKIEYAFNMAKILNSLTDENQDTLKILKLFLNTLYLIQEGKKEEKLLISIFKIKMMILMGFSLPINTCANCKEKINDEENIYYDYVSNNIICEKCFKTKDSKRYIKLSSAAFKGILYTINSDVTKVFNFELKDIALKEYILFGQVFLECLCSGI